MPWDVCDAAGVLLLKKGLVIQDERQIRELIKRGVLGSDALAPGRPESRLRRADASSGEEGVFWVWEDMQLQLGLLLRRQPGDEDAEGFPDQVRGLAALVDHQTSDDTDVACFFISMATTERYPVAHMLHSAIVCAAVARHLAWSSAKRLSAICAALTMNIGMLRLQEALSNSTHALTPAEREAIRRHPERGCDLLRQLGVDDELWLDAVRQHHENQAGTGYPSGIIPFDVADLVGKADVFTAKISPRKYRRGLSPKRALRDLFVNSGGVSDEISSAMVREFGVYPPGVYVQLINNEIGVVVRRGERATEPVVAALIDRVGQPHPGPVRRDTRLPRYKVKGDMPSGLSNVWLNREDLFRMRG